MNSRQRRKLRRFSVRMWKSCDLSSHGMQWKLDPRQPDIGQRIITGQIEITRNLIEFGVIKD